MNMFRIKTAWQRRFAARALVGVFLFGLFTGLAPCKYSGRAAFLHATGLERVMTAQDNPAPEPTPEEPEPAVKTAQTCNCTNGIIGGCAYAYGCQPTNWGCGFMWMEGCIGYIEYPDIWVGFP